MNYAVGTLVRARGREWVVLPESTDELLILKPLAGSEDEITGILSSVEEIRPASFSLPGLEQRGDHHSCRMLHSALRLSFRNSAGPLRSFGKLAVDPRPYQLVPLMLALKQDVVRLLISDDVGIGKTIEACLIVRELLDRGEISRSCVLCPPHLTKQWQDELLQKFGINSVIVSGSSVARLEKERRKNQSLFEVFRHTVVSIDYIKSDRHRDDFLRTAPEMIIVDEAHESSYDDLRNSSRHQRYALIKQLAKDPDRHVILVTATPHSGSDRAFRSLLGFLDETMLAYPDDLSGPENEDKRARIAQHFIQRRRIDIQKYLENTVFPVQMAKEQTYKLTQPYRDLFAKVMAYAQETVRDETGGAPRQRVRWWSALTLLRTLASSPAAAAATMRNRSLILDANSLEEADDMGRRIVLDAESADASGASDVIPGSDTDTETAAGGNRRKLLEMARLADALCGDQDNKVLELIGPLRELLRDNFQPIVFCRYIQTADYLAEQLKQRLKGVEIMAVTGLLPPEERESRIEELAKHTPRILVCTDCLSEGINLQEHFNAVIHYDLSWNPTRHEQREGRIDRFRQPHSEVRVITYYGVDNQIDGVVLDILIRKHKQIKNSLGISVPVPTESDSVLEAVFEGLLLREQSSSDDQIYIEGFNEFCREHQAKLHSDWEDARAKEVANRAMFAQRPLAGRVDEISKLLDQVRESIGSAQLTREFFSAALRSYGARLTETSGAYTVDVQQVKMLVRESCGLLKTTKVRFDLPVQEDELYLSRTHPHVEGLADLVLNAALDGDPNYAIASRCGVFRTKAVREKTVLLLIRYRFHLLQQIGDKSIPRLAEDSQIAAFIGEPDNPSWLTAEETAGILQAEPSGNILPQLAKAHLDMILHDPQPLFSHLNQLAKMRSEQLAQEHTRVREVLQMRRARRLEIRPELPPDILGIYVYLPDGGNNG